MVETAEWASDIDVSRAESALERAQEQHVLKRHSPVHKIGLRLRVMRD
ncbi:hypothetical protein J4G08_01555 [Candidatus Poribacteria bacterium]|nr:hypothetical protein [Candidatus Poribacteria bacterium]